MKIFNNDGKINFVDDNNVLIGFDNCQQCCESFGWFVCSNEPTEIVEEENAEGIETEGYQFDTNYFKELSLGGGHLECEVAIFRLGKDGSEIYLALYNSHNGYYSRGFDMSVGGETIVGSYL